MLLTGIAFLSGIVLAAYSPVLLDSAWLLLLPIVVLLAVVNPKLRVIGMLISGFLWATLSMHVQLQHRLPQSVNHKRLVVHGEVINIPRPGSTSTRFQLIPSRLEGYNGRLPLRIRLSWRNAPETLQPGQVWQLRVKLKTPHGYQNPGGFDYERWLFSQQIQATGYVLPSPQNRLVSQSGFSINRWRMDLNRWIDLHCPGCAHRGLLQALLTGDRSQLDPQTRRLLQQTGTAHLIAVSGLHIGLIAGIFYFSGYRLWRFLPGLQKLPRPDFAMLAAFCGGLAYSFISGFALPAQRAMMMLAVLLIIRLLRLPLNLLQATVAAVMLVLIVSPLAVLSASFWLTLNALLVIVYGASLLQSRHGWFKRLLLIQLLFSLLYIPIGLVIFNQLHPASLLANLVAVPWVSLLIVPFNFLLLTLAWLPDRLLGWLYAGLDQLLGLLMDYLGWLIEHGFEVIAVNALSVWWLILLLLGLLLVVQPGPLIPRFMLLLFVPLLVFLQPDKTRAALTMTVLDVGMGTSVVVQTRHHSLVYDFGPGNDSGYSLGQWVVLPFLRHQGISRPDAIVLSHADQDHIGGLRAVQQVFGSVPIFSGMQAETGVRLPQLTGQQDCHRTRPWFWDKVRFEFLQTKLRVDERDNNRSCVLKVSFGAVSLLLSGDVEREQERRLLQHYASKLEADVLVAPHHGSLTSSSPAFIEAVAARHVIFTTGFLNRWRFPRPEVVARYRQTGAMLYNTATDGAVEVRCDQQSCRVNGYRQRRQYIWY